MPVRCRFAHRKVHLCTAAFPALLSLVFSTAAVYGQSAVVVSPVVAGKGVAPQQFFTATVNPLRKSVIGSATDGRVLDFFVNDGQRVAAEQPLAQLRTKALDIEIAGAKAELALRQQELNELENGSLPEEIEQARARMASAQALYDFSKTRLTRTQRLYESGQAVSQEEYDQVRSAYLTAEQSLIEAQQAHELAVKGPRAERIAQAAARVAVQQEMINQLEDRLAKHTIRAPFDGFVSAEHTEKGAWVKQGDAVAEVIQIDPVEIEVFVPESYIRFVRAGQECHVSIEALPDQTFPGEVVRVVPQGNLRSRTFPVKVQVDNPEMENGDFALKAGMSARVELPVGNTRDALLVHKDAIVLGGQSPLVYVVEGGKAQAVPVRTGFAVGSYFTVEGQLRPGQQVVVAGNERLRPGADVRVTEERKPQPL